MKHYPIVLALSLVAPLVGCDDDGGGGPDAGPGEKRLVILFTNDEHSHLFGFAPEIDDHPTPTSPGTGEIVGGIARRAKVLKTEREAAAAAGAATVTVSSGDETQGALPQVAFATGAPDFVLMKDLGYDVMTPGNHEFDLGPGAFAAAIGAAMAGGGAPQIVATNLHFDATSAQDDTLEALFGEGTSDKPIKRYHVLTTSNGIKVGFFGVMGIQASFYAPLKGPVRFSVEAALEDGYTGHEKVVADIQPTITALRDVEQVDIVVMVSHGGVVESQPDLGDDWIVAELVNGIDVIVSGHSHIALAAPQMATAPDGYKVPILEAGALGEYVGRMEFVLRAGQRPTLDAANTRLIPVDDRVVPDDSALLTKIEGIIQGIEANALEDVLSRIEGQSVVDDPNVVGDLYFREFGSIDFDIQGFRRSEETNILNLSTDSMLAAAREFGGETLISVNASGSVRNNIKKGKTGKLTLADLYGIFPLGLNPLDGSIGYPLCRFYLFKVEIKGAFELAVSQGIIADALFLSPGGLRVEFDMSRPAANLDPIALLDPQNGRVTKITLDTTDDGVENPTVVFFDLTVANDEWLGGPADVLFPVVTSLYVASFAESAGVTLKDAGGGELSLTEAILERPDGTDVKEFEAFISYVRDQAAANGGKLPARYNEAVAAGATPRRMICTAGPCPGN